MACVLASEYVGLHSCIHIYVTYGHMQHCLSATVCFFKFYFIIPSNKEKNRICEQHLRVSDPALAIGTISIMHKTNT